jgi:DNA modification methylase
MKGYNEFLMNKVVIAEDFGFEVDETKISTLLYPHQRDIVLFCLRGGRRACFADFGMGKTFMQLEIAKQCIDKFKRPFLICCPLAVAGEFKRDNKKLGTGYDITYISDTDNIEGYGPQIYITNYERVRKGDIDPSKFCGVSFDEASILRNLKTETTNYVLNFFGKVPLRFVFTATPTPNDFIEILNYAVFLNVISRGHALTRFFQRDSTKAGHLTLYPNKEKEFWQWCATWGVFINKPSELGYSDDDYKLPALKIIEHCVKSDGKDSYQDRDGNLVLFKNTSNSLIEVSKEKRESIAVRCEAAYNIAVESNAAILWHHLEDERKYLEVLFKEKGAKSVFGGQSNKEKEELLMQFSDGAYPYLLTKPKIAGSGCNFQEHCYTAVFVGIDHKFNDFIQAIHRLFRFGQKYHVNIHIVFTNNELPVLKTLYTKWENHRKLQQNMVALVREYGLNKQIIQKQMERQVFKDGKMIQIGDATLYNNDTVIIYNELPSNSSGMILTSIPFGDHYEYSDNYNDMGHNHGNENFFKQMDFLTPNLLRVLMPGRIAAIHVKDRIRYSYQNGTSFTTLDEFSDDTVKHFKKHGFHYIGRITITTDVVRENNQTYRLGWTEKCKDASKMGVGLPEYVLLFRKAPTENKNAYADKPVEKRKEDFTRALWQLDAHSYWRSSGDRFLTNEELRAMDMNQIYRAWEKHNKESIYNFNQHLQTCEYLDELGKLSSLFMSLPIHSNNGAVWTDINRMNTLNAKQVNGKREKHICPLQLDIIERLIDSFTMEGDLIDDPFGGLFSTPYLALKKKRKARSVELNSDYFKDGVFYIESLHHHLTAPTLFDVLDEGKGEVA